MRRLTIRARLTLVYGGLFFLAGGVLLGLTYFLVRQQLLGPGPQNTITNGPEPAASGPSFMTGDTFSQGVVEAQGDALRQLLVQGTIALLLVGVVATAFGYLLSGRLLQPLQRVTETARRIADAPAADRGLHERLALSGPRDEVKDLADTFDLMLERLDGSFDGQRRFIANASHELRTPLTLNRALIEVALAQGTDVRLLGETLLDINARHERLIDGLLLLAASERELDERSYVDMADIVEHIAATTPAEDVTVTTATAEAATTGNPVLLERLVQNLVENGVRNNEPGGRVHVTSATRDGRAVVEVTNTGPVVPRYEIPGLFEPFRRLADRVRAPGAGLGLSIVRAVAHAHGGDVRAEPGEGGGLVVVVELPGAD
ncbi:sensor protein CutS [Actinorhabdospora filicis]|uniref:histidine kinase n=1 Tax=Actinorhabdospora filicis TaxID=1785913 RepID=A0A9W6W1K0_9ACTN|nr:ATP-binding protein [Actinorhabdospora filicis]GLZ75982.1 sensor protein CutS [Actinorhabdospora filicis]